MKPVQKPAGDQVSRTAIAGWVASSDDESTFLWTHNATPSGSSMGVIIVGPLGPESLHCHRAIKCLAHRLQEKRITAIRYDHIGMGDSTGSLFNPDIVDKWIASIGRLHAYLKDDIGVEKVAIIALRSGALLAAKYLEKHTVDNLVLWYPYSQGAAFTRDMEVIDEILKSQSGDNDNYQNAGGFPLSDSTAKQLKAINLSKIDYKIRDRALIISSAETKSNTRLIEKLSSSGNFCDHEILPSLPNLARQAQLSEIPVADIVVISNWLVHLSPDDKLISQKESNSIESLEQHEYVESIICTTKTPRAFGIACSATTHPETNKPIILIPNGGAAHHIGPNRLHTDLARQLAKHGFTSVRFDLSTLGDSPVDHALSDTDPYPLHAVDDIQRMLDSISSNELNRSNQFIIIGLCSGAHNAFHAQLKLKSYAITETVLINPLTFYMQAGDSTFTPESVKSSMDQRYYLDQARDIKVWLDLLKSPRKIIRLSILATGMVFKKILAKIQSLAEFIHLAPEKPLQRDISELIEDKKHLSFFISNNDPGHQMIKQQAGAAINNGIKSGQISITRIASVDHTFSTLESREGLIESLCKHLNARYSVS